MLPISYGLWPNGNNGSVTHSPDPPISHPMPLGRRMAGRSVLPETEFLYCHKQAPPCHDGAQPAAPLPCYTTAIPIPAAPAAASTAFSKVPGDTWLYRAVVLICVCPSSFCTTYRLWLELIKKEANECLKSCIRSSGIPASFRAVFQEQKMDT